MAAPTISSRLRTYGYWGEAQPPSLPQNYTSLTLIKKARAEGKVFGAQLLTAKNLDELGNDDAPALILAPRLYFPEGWNQPEAWTDLLNGKAYLKTAPNGFSDGTALAHARTAADSPSAYGVAEEAAIIPPNGSWAARLELYKPPKTQAAPLFSFFWGTYSLRILDGKGEVMRISPAWTQTKEAQLYTLLQVDNPTEVQQQSIYDLENELYLDRESLNGGGGHSAGLGVGAQDWYNAPLTIYCIPEPGRGLWLNLNGQFHFVERRDEDANLRNEPLWPQTPLTLRCEGGAYFWEYGYVGFAPTSETRLGRFKRGLFINVFDQVTTNYLGNTDGDTTAIAVENETLDPLWSEMVVRLSTGNPRYTPYLYHASSLILAGNRNGASAGGAALFDSENHRDDNSGSGCIVDIEPSYEGPMRRAQFAVTLRDPGGKTFGSGGGGVRYGVGENMVCKLEGGGSTLLTNGIIRQARQDKMKSLLEGQARSLVAKPNTRVRLDAFDAWAILDEDLMEDDPIGDGLWLGAYIRLILQGAGFAEWELAGIPEQAVRILPQAAPGEVPRFRPRPHVPRGEYLRSTIEEWGMGWNLYIDTAGVWHFAQPSAVVAVTLGAGGLRVYDSLSLENDTNDFYNWIKIVSEDAKGNPIATEFPLWKSIRAGSGTPSKTFIGRKKMDVREVTAARSEQDLAWVRRSLSEYFAGTPRFHVVETAFVPNLTPWRRAIHDGITCRIAQITGGSIKNRRSNLLVQELE